jgi:tRNA-binding EMAP/Myf-like protein
VSVSVFFTAAHFNNTPTHTHTLTYTQVVCCMNLKSGNVKGVESNGRLLVATSKEVRVCVCVYVCVYVRVSISLLFHPLFVITIRARKSS